MTDGETGLLLTPDKPADAAKRLLELLADGPRRARLGANARALIERKNEYRNTLVKKGATLGANCTIVCGATVGEYAFIGAGAVVNKDVPAYALVVGVPARQIGWMSEYGEQLDLPLHGESEATCPHTGARYALNGASVIRLSA